MRSAELATKAADILEKYGWVQGHVYKDGRSCLVGALWTVAAADELPLTFLGALVRHLDAPFDIRARSILDREARYRVQLEEWNDAPQRTAEQVIKELRSFAEELENP